MWRVITLIPRGKADTPIEKSRNATPAMVIGLCMRESAGLTVMTMIGLRRHTNLSECVQSLAPGGNVAIYAVYNRVTDGGGRGNNQT